MMPFRFRKNKILLHGLMLLCFMIFSPLPAQKTKSKNQQKELENKKNHLVKEIELIKKSLDSTRHKRDKSIQTLLNLDLRLKKREELISIINAQIQIINTEIRYNETQAQQLKNSLEKLKKEYARMILFAQRNQDAYTHMMFIFAADNFNQAYARLKYVQQYSEFRKKQAAEIVATQTELLKKIEELKALRRDKNILLGNEEEEKATIKKEKQDKETALNQLQKKEKELKAELEKKKKAAAQLQQAIRQMIEAEIKRKNEEKIRKELKDLVEKAKAKQKKGGDTKPEEPKKKDAFIPDLTPEAQALSASFATNIGKLPWPVERGYICVPYGEYEHPAIPGFTMFNNGVEICTAEGAKARAVFEGEVSGIAVSPTGGKLVIIRHGEYLSVYTNLDHVLVKTGDKIKLKQVIGTVMFNEEEGKQSINLQIWRGQKTMNPADWLTRVN